MHLLYIQICRYYFCICVYQLGYLVKTLEHILWVDLLTTTLLCTIEHLDTFLGIHFLYLHGAWANLRAFLCSHNHIQWLLPQICVCTCAFVKLKWLPSNLWRREFVCARMFIWSVQGRSVLRSKICFEIDLERLNRNSEREGETKKTPMTISLIPRIEQSKVNYTKITFRNAVSIACNFQSSPAFNWFHFTNTENVTSRFFFRNDACILCT